MIRETIKKEIEKQGISIYRLAKLSGVQITQINRYLRSEKALSSESIEKILKALGCVKILLIMQSNF